MFGTSFLLLLDPHIYDIWFQKSEIAVRIRLKVFKTKPLVSVCHATLEIHWKPYPLFIKKIKSKYYYFQYDKSSSLKFLVLDAGNDGRWSRWSKMLIITDHFNFRSERTNVAKELLTTFMLCIILYSYHNIYTYIHLSTWK